MNRLKEGFVLIPNPRTSNRLGRVDLSPNNVDCIAFWTKNPTAVLGRLSELAAMGYAYDIQFTLTPYGTDVEPSLPPKADLLRTLTQMSEQIGALRSVWRYDPVLLTERYTVAQHLETFEYMAKRLAGRIDRCIFSFVEMYKKHETNLPDLIPITADEMDEIAPGAWWDS